MATSPSSAGANPLPRDKVRVINLSHANYVITLPSENATAVNGQPRWGEKQTLAPLGVSKYMDRAYAEEMVKIYEPTSRERQINRAVIPIRHLVLEPAAGHEIVEVTAMGSTFKSCKGRGSSENGTSQKEPVSFHVNGQSVRAPALFHSVHQAFQFMLQVSDPESIKAYLVADRRPLVQDYGRALLEYRIANLERAQQGVEPERGANARKTADINNRFLEL